MNATTCATCGHSHDLHDQIHVLGGIRFGCVYHDSEGPCLCNAQAPAVAPTLPPTSSAEQEAEAFMSLIKRVGEGQARWSRLLELLESQEQGT